MVPLPQTAAEVVVRQFASHVVWFGGSHCSPDSSTPFPQAAPQVMDMVPRPSAPSNPPTRMRYFWPLTEVKESLEPVPKPPHPSSSQPKAAAVGQAHPEYTASKESNCVPHRLTVADPLHVAV
jgi:hypothetical protein